ncbi:hypothetical protein E3N88_29127 [Mikania micrantha]|uniref:Uncharacterized protein n=1 Tax=Mikania micrantha TaxID=192012 RepID=A0A5N6N2G9_9ASTR|nr:hypothetical protein E3N88_29127 [Mikania micrantha]
MSQLGKKILLKREVLKTPNPPDGNSKTEKDGKINGELYGGKMEFAKPGLGVSAKSGSNSVVLERWIRQIFRWILEVNPEGPRQPFDANFGENLRGIELVFNPSTNKNDKVNVLDKNYDVDMVGEFENDSNRLMLGDRMGMKKGLDKNQNIGLKIIFTAVKVKEDVTQVSKKSYAGAVKGVNKDDKIVLQYVPPMITNSGEKIVQLKREHLAASMAANSLTLYGYLIGTKLSFGVVNYNLLRIFENEEGMGNVLQAGVWPINNIPLCVKKWEANLKLCKQDPIEGCKVKQCSNVDKENDKDNGVTIGINVDVMDDEGFQTVGRRNRVMKTNIQNDVNKNCDADKRVESTGQLLKPRISAFESWKEQNVANRFAILRNGGILDDVELEDIVANYDEKTGLYVGVKDEVWEYVNKRELPTIATHENWTE